MAMKFSKAEIIANRKCGDPGVGVFAITGATPHTTDQDVFCVHCDTDAVINIKAIDESTHTGVTLKSGTEYPVYLLQVTAITSGTIHGIYQ